MMKKFLLVVCGSFVGVTLALFFFLISSIIMSIAMMGMGSMGKSGASVQKHSILRITLDDEIAERETSGEFSPYDLMMGDISTPSSLAVMVEAIEKAADDKDIDGIYLDCQGSLAAPASREALHAALKNFKAKSGKWIYAYANEGYDQGDYYLASTADSIFLNPIGAVDLHGLASATQYYKQLLDKIGVEMQVIRVGSFKSAVEPFMIDSISPANRLQQEVYLGNIWSAMRDSMAKDRNIDSKRFDTLVDSILITQSPDTLKLYKLVDALCYPDEMEARLRKLTNVDKDDDLRFVSPSDIADGHENEVSGDHIAVLFAAGEIDGSGFLGGESGINSEKLCKNIKDLKDNKHVKGLVLRVNSPGGSAFGSEQIWHALEEFKKSGKPLAVSMGDYAASGGYYISSGAQRIFAERTTITGSIGIFGMIPCYQELAENKLGVYTSIVKTNANSDLGLVATKKLTPTQKAALQNMINRGYELFTKRCADGRKIAQDSIKKIAEGRVWDGVSAKNLGLVDEFGGIADAVKWVAKQAGIKEDKCKTQNYPALSSDWKSMFSQIMRNHYEMQLQNEMGIFYPYRKELMKITSRSHVLCLMEEPELKF